MCDTEQLSLPARVVWAIEYRDMDDVGVAELARDCGVSRFQLARAFVAATGQSISAYSRARRLSRAAEALRAGAVDILPVALEHGYGSHEAFTRAFRSRFGVTPEAVRQGTPVDPSSMMEPIEMTSSLVDLAPHRIAHRPGFRVVGLDRGFTAESTPEVPALWRALNERATEIDDAGETAYGVCHGGDDGEEFRYLAGIEARGRAPSGMRALDIPPGRYAVWTHAGHVSRIRDTWTAILSGGLGPHALRRRAAPDFELYGPDFDPATGEGGVEIWVPIED